MIGVNILKKLEIYVRKSVLMTFLISLLLPISLQAATIKNMRIGQGSEGYRIVFDADAKFSYKAFLLNEPRRLVVDAYNCNISGNVENHKDKIGLITRIRVGSPEVGAKRIALDLKTPIIIKKHLEHFYLFNTTTFFPSDFVSGVNFDKLIIERIG